MASGCIMEIQCLVCGEIVWEDEWDMHGEIIVHRWCKGDAILKAKNTTRFQYSQVKSLENIKSDMQSVKNLITHCQKEMERLEELIRKHERDGKDG